MSGIYIHIPFCASRCIYCDFFSTTLRGKESEYANALIREFEERKDFLPQSQPVKTIYFGGGTPSQMPVREVSNCLESLGIRDVSCLEEITIEANPEDVTEMWAEEIGRLNEKYCGNLRISLGVQSLDDDELKILNRRHDSKKPKEAVELLRQNGIKNISLDLMYGLPTQSLSSWEISISGILNMNPEHISAYCLSVEEGTRMERLVKQGKLTPASDELCLEMAAMLRDKLRKAGYIQYEISNYCKPGFESKHNSSYWDGTPYLGLGPGAHSYDGNRQRVWNECNLQEYINGNRKEDGETLSDTDIYNERIMLGLRTAKGVDLNTLNIGDLSFDYNKLSEISPTLFTINNNHLILSESGLALADEVIRELILISKGNIS